MSVLFRKMLRDIRHHLGQFIAATLILGLGFCCYFGLGFLQKGLFDAAQDLINNTHAGNIWLYDVAFSPEDLRKLKDEGLLSTANRRLHLQTQYQRDGAHKSLELYFPENVEVNSLITQAGKPYDLTDTQADIWLDARYAEANKYQVGDRISLDIQGTTRAFTIAGLVLSPEYVFRTSPRLEPEYDSRGFAFLPLAMAPQRPDGTLFFNEIVGTIHPHFVRDHPATAHDINYLNWDEVDAPAFRARLHELLGRETTYSRFDTPFGVIDDNLAEMSTSNIIMSWSFILVSLFITMVTMVRLIRSQRVELGTLRALGFSRTRLLLHYISYGFWPPLIGMACGMLAGPAIAQAVVLGNMKYYYSFPELGNVFDPHRLITCGCALLANLLTVYLSVRSALKLSPATSLQPHSVKKISRLPLEHTRCFQKLSFSARWNYRDALRNPLRSIMTLLGAAGCTMIVISVFIVLDLQGQEVKNYAKLRDYASVMELSPTISNERAQEIARQTEGSIVYSCSVELEHNNTEKRVDALILDSSSPLHLADLKKQKTDLSEEGCALTRQVAHQLHVQENDTIRLRQSGQKDYQDIHVKKLVYDPLAGFIYITPTTAKQLGLEIHALRILSPKQPQEIGNYDEVEHVLTPADEAASYERIWKTKSSAHIVSLPFAIILLIAVIYTITSLLFIELYTEFATLRTLGFSVKKIRALVIEQIMFLFCLALLPGCWLGIEMTKSIYANSRSLMAIPDRYTPSVVGTCALVLILAFSAAILYCRQLKKIDLVAALKGSE